MKSLKVILADDNLAFRQATRRVLEKEYHAEIIGEASNGKMFLSLHNHHLADLIFMDVMMPDIDGITLTKKILWHIPNLKIVAVTMHVDKVYLSTLVEAGFKGCIFKQRFFEEIGLAIHNVMEGNLHFPKNILFA